MLRKSNVIKSDQSKYTYSILVIFLLWYELQYDAFLTSVSKGRTACFWGIFHYPNRSKGPQSAHVPPPALTSCRMAKSLFTGTKFQHPMGLKEPKKAGVVVKKVLQNY